jgi:hypothetical protein
MRRETLSHLALKSWCGRVIVRDMGIPLARVFFLAVLLLQAVNVRQTQSGVVKGVLRTSTDVPLEGVRVAVEPVDSGLDASVLEGIGLTDKEGRYVLENVSPGRYRIVIGRIGSTLYHPGVTAASQATSIVVTAGETVEVPDMIFKRTSIAGKIVDLDTGRGRRIQSLTLCCESTTLLSGPNFSGISLLPITTVVKEDGTFIFLTESPGDYYVHAEDPGVVPVAQAINLGQDDVIGLEVRVTSGVTVEGRVTDRFKQPVPSVNVTLKAVSGSGLTEGRATPSFTGAVVSRISLNGTPASPPSIAEILPRLVIEDKPRLVTTNAEGMFSFSRLIPGKYTLEIYAPGVPAFSRPIEVGPQGLIDTVFEVPFTQLSGRIVVADGSPMPKLTGSVRFVSTEPDSRILFGFPDDGGRFSVLMASGEYRLFTDGLNVDRYIESISDGSTIIEGRRFIFDDLQPREVRITIAP